MITIHPIPIRAAHRSNTRSQASAQKLLAGFAPTPRITSMPEMVLVELGEGSDTGLSFRRKEDERRTQEARDQS
jgi:hypothetical protein